MPPYFGRRETKGWINLQQNGDLFRKFINLLLPDLWIHSFLINKIRKELFSPFLSFPSRNIFNKDMPSYLDVLTFIFIQNVLAVDNKCINILMIHKSTSYNI